MLLDYRYARIRIQHPPHGNGLRCSDSLGCSRSVMKSPGNLSKLSSSVSHDFAFGSSTTALPILLMRTSSPAKRNSFGRRTAWLSPFLNSFAVFMVITSHIYYPYISKESMRPG